MPRKCGYVSGTAYSSVHHAGRAGIYYGTEIGMDGGGTKANRKCMPWEEIDAGSFAELTGQVKQLIAMRRQYPQTRSGKVVWDVREDSRLLHYYKKKEGQKTLEVCINAGGGTGADRGAGTAGAGGLPVRERIGARKLKTAGRFHKISVNMTLPYRIPSDAAVSAAPLQSGGRVSAWIPYQTDCRGKSPAGCAQSFPEAGYLNRCSLSAGSPAYAGGHFCTRVSTAS